MKSVSRALRYLFNYWQVALGGGLALLLVNLANLTTPQLLRLLIDDGIANLNMTRVWQVAGALVGVAFVRGVFNFLQGFWSEVASQGVAYDLRNSIFEKLQKLSFSYHDRSQTGKLMTRMTSDVEMVRHFVGRGALLLASAILMLLGTLAVMFWMNWKLALIVFAIVPVILVFFSIFVRRIMPVSMRVQKKLGALNTILQENLAGMRVVKAFAREDYETARYLAQNEELLDENVNLVKLFSSIFPLIFFVANLGMVAVVWFGGLEVIGLRLTLGELVAFTGYLGFMLVPIFQMGMIGAMLSRAEASAQRLFEVIDARSEVEDKPDATPLPDLEGRVTFDQVGFRYVGGSEDVINDVSFTAEPGQTIAILGQTGAGKSSIINLIPRFYDVTDGAVLIDDHDVRDIQLDSLRKQVGIVLQETTLFSGTIRENIAYGRPDASDAQVIHAARAAQAHEFIAELPDGYDTQVGERGVGLSGGQKQRVAIARALLVNPRILILDDSTSSVDAETEYKIQQALEILMEGRTSFVIAQRISTVRNADQILLLGDGHLAAQGTHEELMQSSELYVEILETQFGGSGAPISVAVAEEVAL
ncbi:MAG: ABC transporter ATP-binding protein [Anaerolineales bacterium]|nr:ABC transporter ATP-binding protein [Anaerolineales bacterium]